MKKKIIHYLKKNKEKVCNTSEIIMVLIVGAIAIMFGIAQIKVGSIISIFALFLMLIFGRTAVEAIIQKVVDNNKEDIE